MTRANGTNGNGRHATNGHAPKRTPDRIGPKGGMLMTGNPGNKGGGRTPDEFKAMCRELASADAVKKRVATILKNPKHKHFVAALKWASEHGYGKPTQPLDVAPGGTLAELLAESWKGDRAGTR